MAGNRDEQLNGFRSSKTESAASKAEGESEASTSASSGASRGSKRSPNGESLQGDGKRRKHTSPQLASSNAPPEYTKEQQEAVETILKCKDNYYEVLGLKKSCTGDEIEKAYKKLALIVHTDKNHAPEAKVAFQAIKKAYDTLIDRELRQRYNDSENERFATQMPQPTTNSGTISQSHQQHPAQNRQQTESPLLHMFSVVVRMVKVVVVSTAVVVMATVVVAAVAWVLKWLLNFFHKTDPAYSLQQSSQYVTRRTTKIWSVPYFVKTDFLSYYADDIAQIEQQVEKEYQKQCMQNYSRGFAP